METMVQPLAVFAGRRSLSALFVVPSRSDKRATRRVFFLIARQRKLGNPFSRLSGRRGDRTEEKEEKG